MNDEMLLSVAMDTVVMQYVKAVTDRLHMFLREGGKVGGRKEGRKEGWKKKEKGMKEGRKGKKE